VKPYIAFLRSFGPAEGAFLVIASSAKEAKRLAWQNSPMDYIEFTDLAVRLMRNTQNALPLAKQDKLKYKVPHVVKNPVGCDVCNVWGAGLTTEGLCGNCNSYPGDKLAGILGKPVQA
jgi:hypothetical protein